jgi:hypothetical protein
MSRHSQISNEGKLGHRADSVDVAARYLVYNLFLAIVSATSGRARPLGDIDEKVETLARAVERGWVEVFERRQKSGAVVRFVALTDEGRRMARKNLH